LPHLNVPMQSVSTVHDARQMLPLQAKFPQPVVVPGVHAPRPLHIPTVVCPLPGDVQVAVPQDMPEPTLAHPPTPHEPVLVRHPFGVVAHRASGPDVTSAHMPRLLGRLQAWQAPAQALLQHTPSTQLLEVQSLPMAHAAPLSSFSPQRPVVRLQVTPMHWVFPVQAIRHEVPFAQANAPGQGAAVAAVQVPVPSQVRAGVRLPAAQIAAAQLVPDVVLAQAPLRHNPVLPQGGAAGRHAASAVPLVTALHVPTLPVLLQAWQAPVQVELQQTPSTQLPDVQSVPSAQLFPFGSFSPQ
jgi:hypothetical protein